MKDQRTYFEKLISLLIFHCKFSGVGLILVLLDFLRWPVFHGAAPTHRDLHYYMMIYHQVIAYF